MKYFAFIFLIIAVVVVSCKKTTSINAGVLFYNGTWSLSSIGASWNGTVVASNVQQGQSSGTADSAYALVPAGTNQITLKAGTNTVLDKNIYAGAGTGSSFIFFDTSTVATTSAILQLTDDLSIPDTGRIKYRVLNLVPDTAVKVDIWLVNGITDSARLDTANVFIGRTASASGVQTFAQQPYYANSYTIKFKKTGTEQVYASIDSYPFVVQNIYSIIFSGLLTGSGSTGFKLSVLHHSRL